MSKLNPNLPKKKLLLFIIVFGLLGGGYYAYRSFADTNMILVSPLRMSGGTPQYVNVNGKNTMIERTMNSEIRIENVALKNASNTWRVCINARDIEGKTDILELSAGTGYMGGGPVEVKIRSGWYDTTVGLGANNTWNVSITGKGMKPNKTIAVSQIALVRHMGACPK